MNLPEEREKTPSKFPRIQVHKWNFMRSLLLPFLHQNTELCLGDYLIKLAIIGYLLIQQTEKQFSLLHYLFSYVQRYKLLPCDFINMKLIEYY